MATRFLSRELLKTKESIFKELEPTEWKLTDDNLLGSMVTYPELIQRLIIVKGKKQYFHDRLEN